VAAVDGGTPVWSAEELAWRLRPSDAAPWLTVTGTNGKTTTVQMLRAILAAAGERAVAAGNIGHPLVDAVLADPPPDVLAVELSSFQLHYTHSVRAEAAALLNITEDHLDWHGGFAQYMADKARVLDGAQRAVVHNADDPVVADVVERAALATGCRRVAFTLHAPAPGMLGVESGALVDRAFGGDGASRVIVRRDELVVPGDHLVADALAAAALGLAHGVALSDVADALRGFAPDAHRGQVVAVVAGVRFVDDSKATNPAAAEYSLRAHTPAVWIAGGLAKGAHFDELVQHCAAGLRGVVLLGSERAVVRDALQRHAPEVPVIEVDAGETGIMDLVVDAAAGLAAPGDTVLLAPGCASTDQYAGYAARGDAFAAAVRRHAGQADDVGSAR
jgi:UDP-N-acetylmuramoylalanine--D-glutamate ligase